MVNTPKEILDLINSPSESLVKKEPEYKRIKNKEGYIKEEHQIIWEEKYGKRPLDSVIHHINGDKKDNRIENLMLFPNHTAHMNFHKKSRRLI